jgi:hypothetical protein
MVMRGVFNDSALEDKIKKRPPRETLNPLGAFTLLPSGEKISRRRSRRLEVRLRG